MDTLKITIHKAQPVTNMSERTLTFNTDQRNFLFDQGFTKGMIHQLERVATETLVQIWILDKSASTNQMDCSRFERSTSMYELRPIKCSRWEDIKETALYHAHIAISTHRPMVFRLLNACPDMDPQFVIANKPSTERGETNKQEDLFLFREWLQKVDLRRRTSVTHHMNKILQWMQSMKRSKDHNNGEHVVLIIATDGFPSDDCGVSNHEQCEIFQKSLKLFEKLRIQILFRLNANNSALRKVRVTIRHANHFPYS